MVISGVFGDLVVVQWFLLTVFCLKKNVSNFVLIFESIFSFPKYIYCDSKH